MAEYEQTAGTVIDNLISDSGGLSAATEEAIISLLPQNPEESVAIAEYTGGQVSADTVILNVGPGQNLTSDPGGGQAIIMAAGTSAQVTFSAESPTDVLVVGDGGGSDITFEGDKPVTVQLTGGSNDAVNTGGGSDTIYFDGGTASVAAGTGNDVLVIQNNNNTGSVTVDAGDGFDRVSINDQRANHHFKINPDGTITMHSNNEATMKGVNVVTFDINDNNVVDRGDQVTVLAQDANDALVAKLYKVALGREPIDGADGWDGSTLGGLTWWTTQYNPDATPEQLAKDFLGEPEFNASYAGMDNAQFAEAIFTNLNDGNPTPVTKVNGQTAAEYAQQLDAGMITREEVAFQVASSQEAADILGIDGIGYVIEYPGA